MTNFFEQQDDARRRTWRLIPLVSLGTIPVILASYGLALVTYNLVIFLIIDHISLPASFLSLWVPWIFIVSTLATLSVLAGASVYKSIQLSKGGRAVAEAMGARAIRSRTAPPVERRVLNVVAEMSIAAGLPIPRVYVLDEERGINAFAAGYTPRDAIIALSRGSMEELDRDELQAVIAHEISHILNGDMRLNMHIVCAIQGFILYDVLGERLLERAHIDEDHVDGASLIAGFFLKYGGALGAWVGKAIRGSVNRQREFLADASAVQFTRNPDAVVRVLKKIGGHPQGSRMKSARSEEISHLFFGNAHSISTLLKERLLSSHPPLLDRVRRLEPAFDGTFPPYVPRGERVQRDLIAAETFGDASGKGKAHLDTLAEITPERLLAMIGAPGADQLAGVRALLEGIPASLRTVAEGSSTSALICALLLDTDEVARRAQLSELGGIIRPSLADEVRRFGPQTAELSPAHRLPLLDMCLPYVRQMSREETRELLVAIDALSQNDERISLFEFLTREMVRHFSGLDRDDGRPRIVQYYNIRPLTKQCNVLISALCHLGHESDADKARAHKAAFDHLEGTMAAALLPLDQCNLEILGEALGNLLEAAPRIKESLFRACVYCVAEDGTITAGEGELLRAIGHILDCPLPPIL